MQCFLCTAKSGGLGEKWKMLRKYEKHSSQCVPPKMLRKCYEMRLHACCAASNSPSALASASAVLEYHSGDVPGTLLSSTRLKSSCKERTCRNTSRSRTTPKRPKYPTFWYTDKMLRPHRITTLACSHCATKTRRITLARDPRPIWGNLALARSEAIVKSSRARLANEQILKTFF